MEINWIAVLAATGINIVLGMIWYSPSVLGNKWLSIMKTEQPSFNPTSSGAQKEMMLSLPIAILFAFFTVLLVSMTNSNTAMAGAMIGIYTWVGYVLTSGLTSMVYEQRNKQVLAIYLVYQLISNVLMGAVAGYLG